MFGIRVVKAGGVWLALFAAGLATPQALAQTLTGGPATEAQSSSDRGPATAPAPESPPSKAAVSLHATFSGATVSDETRQVADWVVKTADNGALPFAIIDKVNAEVLVFDAHGRLRGASPALLGLAKGDDTVPGIGNRALSAIRPEQRTTPAGRFVSSLGRDFDEKNVLWIDYAAGIAMHRVVTSNPKEHRLQRLATPSTLDNRISFGCINVPAKFYDDVVSPAFTGTFGIVYILPEIKSIQQVFFDSPRLKSGGGNPVHAQ